MSKDMSCVRVKQYKSSTVNATERHNERKNATYTNMNVIKERIPFNVYFKECETESYMDYLHKLENEGKLSLRGLRQDATLFDEIVIDVNTMYFERNGGYDYAKRFYEDAFHFLERKFGPEYIVSAVMHSDELNIAASEELGRAIFHYHMHAVVIPVVDKEIRWSKRCKDVNLRGTVREVVHQVSHSKKWASTEVMKDKEGNALCRANGAPRFVPSYSILQDGFVDYMRSRGYLDFQRGERGSTRENLSSLQYQIKKDKERLNDVKEEKNEMEEMIKRMESTIKNMKLDYKRAARDYADYHDVNRIQCAESEKRNYLLIEKSDYKLLKDLATEAVTSRSRILEYEQVISFFEDLYNNLVDRFNKIVDTCKVFFMAKVWAPDIFEGFIDKVTETLSIRNWNHVKNPVNKAVKSSDPDFFNQLKGRDDYER